MCKMQLCTDCTVPSTVSIRGNYANMVPGTGIGTQKLIMCVHLGNADQLKSIPVRTPVRTPVSTPLMVPLMIPLLSQPRSVIQVGVSY